MKRKEMIVEMRVDESFIVPGSNLPEISYVEIITHLETKIRVDLETAKKLTIGQIFNVDLLNKDGSPIEWSVKK